MDQKKLKGLAKTLENDFDNVLLIGITPALQLHAKVKFQNKDTIYSMIKTCIESDANGNIMQFCKLYIDYAEQLAEKKAAPKEEPKPKSKILRLDGKPYK